MAITLLHHTRQQMHLSDARAGPMNGAQRPLGRVQAGVIRGTSQRVGSCPLKSVCFRSGSGSPSNKYSVNHTSQMALYRFGYFCTDPRCVQHIQTHHTDHVRALPVCRIWHCSQAMLPDSFAFVVCTKSILQRRDRCFQYTDYILTYLLTYFVWAFKTVWR